MPNDNRLHPATVHALGVWALRLLFAGGLIYGFATDKDPVVGVCVMALLWSFILLDA